MPLYLPQKALQLEHDIRIAMTLLDEGHLDNQLKANHADLKAINAELEENGFSSAFDSIDQLEELLKRVRNVVTHYHSITI